MPRIRDVYESNADKIPFDFYEVLAALAPRGCFSNSPVHDDNFDIRGVRLDQNVAHRNPTRQRGRAAFLADASGCEGLLLAFCTTL